MRDLYGCTDADKGVEPEPLEMCDYCGWPIIAPDETTDYRALQVMDAACSDCLREMALNWPCGKYWGGD
jgi:hypothetical protein